jgi:hypothetical protein
MTGDESDAGRAGSGSSGACGRRLRDDDRADVPMRIAPMLLVGLVLVVLAIVGSALL